MQEGMDESGQGPLPQLPRRHHRHGVVAQPLGREVQDDSKEPVRGGVHEARFERPPRVARQWRDRTPPKALDTALDTAPGTARFLAGASSLRSRSGDPALRGAIFLDEELAGPPVLQASKLTRVHPTPQLTLPLDRVCGVREECGYRRRTRRRQGTCPKRRKFVHFLAGCYRRLHCRLHNIFSWIPFIILLLWDGWGGRLPGRGRRLRQHFFVIKRRHASVPHC
mmetsp:Transcript_41689/g.94104  ORF Transcript_41689/g.94104 Transcript_41689/m.94104 type:complete len:224 (-) Transcript_41689:190-861(-)